MVDVILIAVLIAFFALGALFVKACDRIIGTDTDVVPTADVETETEPAAA